MSNKEAVKRYQKKHPLRYIETFKKYRIKRRVAALMILGGICSKCGFSDYRALQIDHINGQGSKELKRIQGAQYHNMVIRSVLNKENKYQLLCANCNWIKKVENNEVKNKLCTKSI